MARATQSHFFSLLCLASAVLLTCTLLTLLFPNGGDDSKIALVNKVFVYNAGSVGSACNCTHAAYSNSCQCAPPDSRKLEVPVQLTDCPDEPAVEAGCVRIGKAYVLCGRRLLAEPHHLCYTYPDDNVELCDTYRKCVIGGGGHCSPIIRPGPTGGLLKIYGGFSQNNHWFLLASDPDGSSINYVTWINRSACVLNTDESATLFRNVCVR